jgi:HK97 family phage major capsid protein
MGEPTKTGMTLDELQRVIRDEVGVALAPSVEALRASIPEQFRSFMEKELTPSRITSIVTEGQRAAQRDKLLGAKILHDLWVSSGHPSARGEKLTMGDGALDRMSEEFKRTGMYSTTTAGGYLVPTEQIMEPINLVGAEFPLISRCRTIPMQTDSITIPTISGGITIYWVPEVTNTGSMASQATGQKQESQYTLGQITLTRYIPAAYLLVTEKLLRTSLGAVQRLIERDVPNRIWAACDDAILTGTATAASDPVTGLDTAISTNVISWNAAFPFDGLVDLVMSVEEQLPGVAETDLVVGNSKALKTLLKVKDGDNNYILTTPRESARGVRNLWGYDFLKDSNIPNTYGDGGDTKLYAGDFGRHANVGFESAMSVLVDPYTYAKNNIVAFRFETPFGFAVSDEKAFASMVVPL